MFKIILLCLVAAAGYVRGNDEQAIAKCVPLFNIKYMDKSCCESFDSMMKKDLLSECKKNKSESDECAFPTCMAEKQGMMNSDGTINDEVTRKVLDKYEEDFPDSKQMFIRTKDKCLDRKFRHYAPSDETCDPVALHLCMYLNSIVECNEWTDNEECHLFSEQALECKAAMDAE